MKDLVPIIVVVGAFAMIMWREYLNHQARRLIHDERRQQIEKGQTPPPLPVAAETEATVQRSLRRGVTHLFLGVGLGLAYLVGAIPGSGNRGFLIGSAIVTMLGIGNLVYYALARQTTKA